MISVFRGLGSPYLPTIKEVEMSNTGITWLHLSDWHEGAEKKLKLGNTYNRDQVRNRLMDDIKKQKRDNPDLNHIDFIIFSGDIAFSGTQDEYEKAEKFFRDVLCAAGFDPNNQEDRKRLFIVPGNHDLERGKFGMLPQDLPKRFTDRDQVPDWLNDEEKRGELLKPFANYKVFATNLTNQQQPDYGYISRLNCEQGGKEVVLLGINSALMAGRKIGKNIDDYGKLIVGEPQITTLLDEVKKNPREDEVRIAVLHHPFEWLAEFDRSSVRNLLIENCHFILCGHQHEQKIYQIQGLEGNYIMIPAGASYENREYHNSYNFVHLDFENQQGKIYLRRWIDDKWNRDDATYKNGEYTFCIPTKKDKSQQVSTANCHQLVQELTEQYKKMDDWKKLHNQWQELCTSLILAQTEISRKEDSNREDSIPFEIFDSLEQNWRLRCNNKLIELLDFYQIHPKIIEEIQVRTQDTKIETARNNLDKQIENINKKIINEHKELTYREHHKNEYQKEVESQLGASLRAKNFQIKNLKSSLQSLLEEVNNFLTYLDLNLQMSIKDFEEKLRDLNRDIIQL
jgi:predicted phosphodiesterase